MTLEKTPNVDYKDQTEREKAHEKAGGDQAYFKNQVRVMNQWLDKYPKYKNNHQAWVDEGWSNAYLKAILDDSFTTIETLTIEDLEKFMNSQNI